MSSIRQRRRFEIYPEFSQTLVHRGTKQRYRWRLKAANNRIVADGGEAYDSIRNCRLAIKRVRKMMSLAGVIVLDPKGKIIAS